MQNENAVAEKLGITQPTVTFHLKNLNNELGIPLYFKKRKCFNLTDGDLLYRNSNKMLNLIDETTHMIEEFKQSKRGLYALEQVMHLFIVFFLPLKKIYA